MNRKYDYKGCILLLSVLINKNTWRKFVQFDNFMQLSRNNKFYDEFFVCFFSEISNYLETKY